MADTGNIDLSALTFDEFVEFLFNRPENEEYWYQEPIYQWGYVAVSNASALVGHATRLFSEFGVIARRYALSQIDHGIWALLADGSTLSIQESLWNSSVPLKERAQCIHSMFHVYSDFVAGSEEDGTETCFNMWWDLIGDGFWSSAELTRQKNAALLSQDLKALLDAMFDTLKRILELPDPRTQRYALHGLGHLHHPAVRDLVQNFIDQHQDELDEEAREWVEQCRDGTVM
jgi:hypothetical protein